MPEITLAADTGREAGTRPSRRLRASGRIPATVYGHGIDAISVSVDARELRHALSGDAGLNQLLDMKVEEAGEHLVLARSLQRHPVRNTVIHVDFQVVRRDEVVSAEVPINLVGESKSVEQERGLIEQPLLTLTVHARPGDIPNSIEVDISELSIGDTIRVESLSLPSSVTTDLDPEEPVVIAAASAMEAEVEEMEAAEAAEAAGEVGAAEGEEPAPSEEGAETSDDREG